MSLKKNSIEISFLFLKQISNKNTYKYKSYRVIIITENYWYLKKLFII